MKIRLMMAVMAIVALCAASAGAFGLPKLPGLGGGGGGMDPDEFLKQCQVAEKLVNQSAQCLFDLVGSKESQAKVEEMRKTLAATTDAKEKAAIQKEIQSTQMAAIGDASSNEQLKKEAASWDKKKKEMGQAAFYNFSLGALQAAKLVPEGQNLVTSIKSNPLLITKVGSLVEAVKSLGGIASGTGKVIKTIPPVFAAAKIEVKKPDTEAAKPLPVSGGI